MPTGRSGVKKILEGVLQAHKGLPPNETTGRLVPRHVIINCVDPRVAPSRYAQLNVSEMFLIRNAGNLVPNSSFVTSQTAATEPAVLELAFTKFNTVKQVALCREISGEYYYFSYNLCCWLNSHTLNWLFISYSFFCFQCTYNFLHYDNYGKPDADLILGT